MSKTTASSCIIRDDSGLKSLSKNEREFTRNAALRKCDRRCLRTDGRSWSQVRPVHHLDLLRWENGASCSVQWGTGTRVTAQVSANLVPPRSDRPDQGTVSISVDLSPAASTAFRQAGPATTGGGEPSSSSSSRGNFPPADEHQKLTANRIVRCLERILLTGGALDCEALCVSPGLWAWKLSVAVTVLDAAGNLTDASVLAAMAAIRHYRKPAVSSNNNNNGNNGAASESDNQCLTPLSSSQQPALIPSEIKEPTPLPLHHTPVTISFALIPEEDVTRSSTASSSSSAVAALVDPNDREELIQTGQLTIAMNVHLEICLLDYPGGCELQPSKLRECYLSAKKIIQQLCHSLEETLQQADQQALSERLQRLQQQENVDLRQDQVVLPPRPPNRDEITGLEGIPYYQSTDNSENDFMQVQDDQGNAVVEDKAAARQAQSAAEEAYRRQALDYNLGHVAIAVGKDKDNTKQQQASSALLASMLQFVQQKSRSDTDQPNEKSEQKPPLPAEEINDSSKEFNAGTQPTKTGGLSVEQQHKLGETLQTTKGKQAFPTRTTAHCGILDSDDEDTTMQLENEFQTVKKEQEHLEPAGSGAESLPTEKKADDLSHSIKNNISKTAVPAVSAPPATGTMVDDADVDDLSAAIKKKKKKGKKNKKSK